jgi:Zn finger protein HypA/HybF involved in hydrogenase expression
MLLAAAGVFAAFIIIVSIVLTLAEHRRRTTPLAFRCVQCGAEFRRSPHRHYPRACPRCGARDWASPGDGETRST